MRIIVIALALLFCSWGYGTSIIRVIEHKSAMLAWKRLLYALSLGMGAIAHLSLFTGFFIGISVQIVAAILIIGCGLGAFWLVKAYKNKQNKLPPSGSYVLPAGFDWILIAVIGVCSIYSLLANVLLPPISYDEIAYHLAIPKIYIEAGRIVYIPFIPYSNWPLEAEMLFGIALIFKSEVLAHFISWWCSLLVTAGLVFEGNHRFGLRSGLIAGLLFSGAGMVTSLAGTALIELPLTLFTFFAMLSFLEWLQDRRQSQWILSALFGGLAASTKLNAAMLPFLLGTLLFICCLAATKKIIPSLVQFVYYGSVAFLVVVPWYIKSWILTGNPFWGFLLEIFPTRDWDIIGQQILLSFIRLPNLSYSVQTFFEAFWLITVDPSKIGPVAFRVGWAVLLLLPVALLAFLLEKDKKKSQFIGFIWLLVIVFYTNWFFQTHQSRFFMPVLPILALLSAAGAGWLLSRFPVFRWVLPILMIGVVIANSWLVKPVEMRQMVEGWNYRTGKLSREEVLSNHLVGYSTLAYANRELPQDAFVWMALYEGRGYYLDRKYEWANPIAQRIIPLEKYENSDQLAKALAQRGYTHIIFRTGQPERFKNIVLNGEQITDLVYNFLQTHTRLIYRSINPGEQLELYEIVP